MKKSKPALFGSIFIMFAICMSNASHAQFSHSPRQAGEEILSELITKPNKIIIRVGSNGCMG